MKYEFKNIKSLEINVCESNDIQDKEKPKKYRLDKTDTKTINGRTLYRVIYLKDFSIIEKGDKGGYIEKEANLSQEGNARVSDNACVSDNAHVYGDAIVSGNARVSGDAWVSDNACVYGDAIVSGNARVSGDARVSDNACVFGDAFIFGDANISGRINLTVNIDYELTPRVIIDTEEKAKRLKEFLKTLEGDKK